MSTQTTISAYRERAVIAQDKITGFKGVVTGHADYITGCDQYLIQPGVKDGEWKEARWFDEGRLVVVDADVPVRFFDVQAEKNGADIPAPVK